MWKNRGNRRVLCFYHTTLRMWMSRFASPTARLWIYGILTTFCLNKLPQMLPVSSFFHDSSSDVLPFHSLHSSGKLPLFHLTVTVEKVKAVAPAARCFPCSTPPSVYGLGDFQLCGFGPLETSSWMEHCFHGAGERHTAQSCHDPIILKAAEWSKYSGNESCIDHFFVSWVWGAVVAASVRSTKPIKRLHH